MLSLIYRELHLTRKTLITCLFVYFLFALWTDLAALSMQIGNLAKYCSPEQLSEGFRLIPMAAIFGYVMLLVTAPEAICQIMDNDFKTPWLKYALSSPRTIREHVGAKYLAFLFMTVFAFVLGWLHVMIACALSGQRIPDGTLLLFLACALAVMAVSSILLPIAYYVQNIGFVNMLITILFALGTLAYTISVLSFFVRNEDAEVLDYAQYVMEKLTKFSGTPLFHAIKILAPFIALLVIIGSFFLSVRILDKRRLVKGGNISLSKKKGGKS
ncbi:MAG: ABC-2 transporter permease [Lachnospiraceae bacterium]|nr:ABC-2 transporter permease [Lachnospiraceae bacterium]